MRAEGCTDADTHAGDGNSNGGKPSFLEAVKEALRRRWHVKIVCKGSNVSEAYKRLRLVHKELLQIQMIHPCDLERARTSAMSSPQPRRACALVPTSTSPLAAAPTPPPPPLSADELRAARLKFFRPPQVIGDAAAADVSVGACADSSVQAPAPCFKGELVPSILPAAHASCQIGMKFTLHQLQWAGDGVHAEAVELIERNGGQVAASLRDSGVTHVICSGAVYRCVCACGGCTLVMEV